MSSHNVRGHWRETKNGYVWVNPHTRYRDEGYQEGNPYGNPENLTPYVRELGFKTQKQYDLAFELATLKNLKTKDFIEFTEEQLVMEIEQYKRFHLESWYRQGFSSLKHYQLASTLAKEEGFQPYQYKSWNSKMCEDKISYNANQRQRADQSKATTSCDIDSKVQSRVKTTKAVVKLEKNHSGSIKSEAYAPPTGSFDCSPTTAEKDELFPVWWWCLIIAIVIIAIYKW